jgi:transposase
VYVTRDEAIIRAHIEDTVMGMRLRVFLNPEEARTLQELRTATTVPQRVRDRADVIRMNARGDYMETIATYFGWHVETVRTVVKRWQKDGLGGLWDAPQPGAKRRWQAEDMAYVESLLEEERTYNSTQLANKLETERDVKLSPAHLRRVLKKRGFVGNAPVTAIGRNKTLSTVRSSKRT